MGSSAFISKDIFSTVDFRQVWSLINQRKNLKNISFLSCQVYRWTCQMISQGLSGFLLGLGGGGNNLERSFCMNALFLPAFIFRKESNTMSHISLPTVNRNSLWERWAFDGMNELHFVPAPLQAETRVCTTPPPNSHESSKVLCHWRRHEPEKIHLYASLHA